MRLVTFQTKEALDVLKKSGVLMADVSHIDLKKYGVPYDWIVQEMKEKRIPFEKKGKYPLWAWVKCGRSIAPQKKKNYSGKKQKLVKITFEKPDEEVLVSDYMAYSFILSGHIVPKTRAEYEQFLQKMKDSLDALKGFIRKEKNGKSVAKLFPKIEKTWDRIFIQKSTVQQACVWCVKMSEVKKIEILSDAQYVYGTMNAKRADGTRPDWKRCYLKFIP